VNPSIEHLQHLYGQLLSSDQISFIEVSSKKKITGVYIIYSAEKEILYIGSTNNFHVRFGTDLKHESTHTLVKKVLKDGSFADRSAAKVHFMDHCLYRICICRDKREAEALEHLAIWLLQPKYNK
jgi:excinuclease UvrABC nuclease subunit